MRCRDYAVTISTTKTTSDYDGGVGKRLLLLIQLESNSFLSHYLRSLGYAGEELTLSFLPPYELQSQNEKCPHYGLNLDKIHFYHQKNMLSKKSYTISIQCAALESLINQEAILLTTAKGV